MNVNYDLKFGDVFKIIKCNFAADINNLGSNRSSKLKDINDTRRNFTFSSPLLLHSFLFVLIENKNTNDLTINIESYGNFPDYTSNINELNAKNYQKNFFNSLFTEITKPIFFKLENGIKSIGIYGLNGNVHVEVNILISYL